MSTELGVYVPGDPAHIDAQRVINGLRHLLELLEQLAGERGKWQFSRLRLGSVDTRFAPLATSSGLDEQAVDAAFNDLVHGFELAEDGDEIPRAWSKTSMEKARAAARELSTAGDEGAIFTVIVDEKPTSTVRITTKASEHLKAVAARRHHSIGSVIGMLETISSHERNLANLWTEIGNYQVPIYFADSQIDQVRTAWKRRVEASGELKRDGQGRPVSLKLSALEVLPTAQEAPSLLGLIDIASRGGDSS